MEEIIASLTPMQKAWFAQSLIELAEDSRVSASNHHLWALGSDTQGKQFPMKKPQTNAATMRTN